MCLHNLVLFLLVFWNSRPSPRFPQIEGFLVFEFLQEFQQNPGVPEIHQNPGNTQNPENRGNRKSVEFRDTQHQEK